MLLYVIVHERGKNICYLYFITYNFYKHKNFKVLLMLQCGTLFLLERPMKFDDLDPSITIKQLAYKGREPLYYV